MTTLRTLCLLVICLIPGAAPSHAGEARPGAPQCAKQLTYLSDTDASYRYLEAVQHGVYQNNQGLTDVFSMAELNSPHSVNSWEELKRRAQRACPDASKRTTCPLDPVMVDQLMLSLPCLKLATRYEAPLFSSLLNLYVDSFRSIRAARYPGAPEAHFGSLPTGQFDAQALLPPDSKAPLIIMDREIFFFTGAFSKALSDSIPITTGARVALDYSEAGIRKRLHDHPAIVGNFADAVTRLASDGSIRGATESTLDNDHNRLHVRLLTAMDMFMISHEDAHVILKHVDEGRRAFRLVGGRTIRHVAAPPRTPAIGFAAMAAGQPADVVQVQTRTRAQELAADALGLQLLFLALESKNNDIDLAIGAAAPHMIFRIIDAVNAYGTEAGTYNLGNADHPPAQERVAALAPAFAAYAASHPALGVDFRQVFDTAFKVLLAEADPQIRRNLKLPQR